MNDAQLQAALNARGYDTGGPGWGPKVAAALAKGLRDPAFRAELMAFRVSPNFTLGEMLKSATADARKILNLPTAQQLGALRALCGNVLEPVRARFGPVRITSGFRIFTPDSQHGKGEAADFEVPGVSNRTVAEWIRDTLRFDQLILEAYSKSDPNAGWIHCSYRADRARKSVLRTPTGGAPYWAGLGS
jgi:hypothetical protein